MAAIAFDALVTRDYLDTRFTEFETRVEANMDKRFAESNTKMDKRFAEIETKTDKRFAEFRLEMHGEIGGVRGDLAELRGTLKLQSWILGVLIVTMLLPVLQRLLV